jgi:methionine-rich copper-binding protein CopC
MRHVRIERTAKHLIPTAVLFVALVAATPLSRLHFALQRSVPAADATVPSPAEIRLWFTEPAKEGSVGIRVLNAGGEAIETGAPVRDETDARVYAVAVTKPLASGRYTVAWRGIGDDGHAVTGELAFTVVGAE